MGRVAERRHSFALLLFLSSLLLWLGAPLNAQAQRAAENVVRAAQDAFGASVGSETIGLYGTSNVRGFSPTEAGNIRLEGLSVDLQASFSDRTISGSTIRAGLAAQGYLLPAPTGIVDFSFRRVADDPVQSIIAAREQYGGFRASADLQARSANNVWEIAGGAGYANEVSGNGSTDKRISAGGNIRFLPNDRFEAVLFADLTEALQDQRWPSYFSANPGLPPRIEERRMYVGQDWAELERTTYHVGGISKFAASFADLEIGVFRSVSKGTAQTGQFFVNITEDGASDLLAFFGPPTRSVSTSMEAKATRDLQEGDRLHRFTVNVRGRRRNQAFGGAETVDLGPMDINAPLFFAMPDFTFGAITQEEVEQITGGVAYDLRWGNVGTLSLGLQKTRYERSIGEVGTDPLEGEASPWLYNASAAVNVTPWLTLYGGVVRGFEEGPVAPDFAVNRNQAPAAIETEQADAGLRAKFAGMTAVAGVFNIEKPFFGLDQNNFFGENGTITNRGFEFSVAGPVIPSLQVVLGAVFFDPTLEGQAVDLGLLSADPIVFRNRRITLDLDYRPQWATGWSFDVNVQHFGRQNGDQQGNVKIDPFSLLNLGFRKQWTLSKATVVLRGRAVNVTDKFSWEADPSSGFFFIEPRTFTLSLGADF